jgi:glycosyltransferase involved in cell wall biosynthesis
MKCALVHDWLVQKGGGESVLEALMELFDGPLYTLFAKEPLKDRPLHTSYLQKIPQIAKFYRTLLPLFPSAIESLDLSPYDLILSSSHTVAKGVITRPGQIHICYCHTPLRCAWDPTPFHLNQVNPLLRPAAKLLFSNLRKWDQKTHTRVDHFIANSNYVAQRIEACYGRKATVIHPPVDVDRFQIAEKHSDYYITCSRLVPYKRVDLLLQAFEKLPQKKLLVVGTGPEQSKLKAAAPKTFTSSVINRNPF